MFVAGFSLVHKKHYWRACGKHSLACYLLMVAGLKSVVAVQVQAYEQAYSFDIPATTLSGLIELLGKQSGVSIAVDAAYMHYPVGPLQGHMSALQALQLLLKGTGLQMRQLQQGTVVLQPASSASPSTLPAGSVTQLQGDELFGLDTQDPQHRVYAAQLQAAVTQVLCQHELTRPGSYRVALLVQVNQQGRVQTYKRLASTGNVRRDQHIDHLIAPLQVGMPPPQGLAQPLVMLVLPASIESQPPCRPTRRRP